MDIRKEDIQDYINYSYEEYKAINVKRNKENGNHENDERIGKDEKEGK